MIFPAAWKVALQQQASKFFVLGHRMSIQKIRLTITRGTNGIGNICDSSALPGFSTAVPPVSDERPHGEKFSFATVEALPSKK
mmetsp:Transcript_31181/g.50494  ORF Transcript_31181/g.50494 Transcript_31181/m.50494 type:complete len:83 (+) Transcript_31181:42-290(+)